RIASRWLLELPQQKSHGSAHLLSHAKETPARQSSPKSWATAAPAPGASGSAPLVLLPVPGTVPVATLSRAPTDLIVATRWGEGRRTAMYALRTGYLDLVQPATEDDF